MTRGLPPAAPAAIGHRDAGVVAHLVATPFVVQPLSAVINDRDLRARSAPGPQRFFVLLI
jgi:hypothetical protein